MASGCHTVLNKNKPIEEKKLADDGMIDHLSCEGVVCHEKEMTSWLSSNVFHN